MFVKVSDVYGAVTTQEATVVVKPVPLDASVVKELTSEVDSVLESGNLAKGTGSTWSTLLYLIALSSLNYCSA